MAVDSSALNWIECVLEGHTPAVSVLNSASFPVPIYPASLPLNVHMLLLMWWGELHGSHGQLGQSFQFHSHVNLLFISSPPLLTPLFWLAHPLGLAMQKIFRKYSKPLSLNITLSVVFLLNIAFQCSFFLTVWMDWRPSLSVGGLVLVSVGHKNLGRSHCAVCPDTALDRVPSQEEPWLLFHELKSAISELLLSLSQTWFYSTWNSF